MGMQQLVGDIQGKGLILERYHGQIEQNRRMIFQKMLFMEIIEKKGAVEETLVEATRVAVNKSLNLTKIDKKNKDKYKSVVKQLRTVLDISMHLFRKY